MLNTSSYEKCEEAAKKVIADFQVTEPPVDILNIVKRIGIELVEYNLGDDTSGVLMIRNKKGTIGYNPNRTSNDLFVDNFFLMKFRGNNSYTENDHVDEQEANAFAAAVLMPENFIDDEMKNTVYRGLTEIDFIGRLAKKFEVSIPAMTYRLTNLNIF